MNHALSIGKLAAGDFSATKCTVNVHPVQKGVENPGKREGAVAAHGSFVTSGRNGEKEGWLGNDHRRGSKRIRAR